MQSRQWEDQTTQFAPNDPTAPSVSDNAEPPVNAVTLLVAGCRGGKSSFLRLLVETSDLLPTTNLQALAKFVQGCSVHTSALRSVSLDVRVDGEPIALTLVDTPTFDFDLPDSERVVSDTVRFIESRLAEGGDEELAAQHGERFVHLCVYFLNPDQIVPSAIAPRGFGADTPDAAFVDPANNPPLHRPTLPLADVATIRRLSARVNVLPVVSRADVLTNERLSAIRLAVRRDLADNGIGFGIFDYPPPNDPSNGAAGAPNTSANAASPPPPSSPSPSTLLRLPYALISPDCYSHSDGVSRVPPSRQDLVLQLTPSSSSPSPNKNLQGRFVRTYRWGAVDVLEPTHSDFVPLRTAIFHHMKALKKYTREYLFDKFRVERLPQRPGGRHHSQGQQPPPLPPTAYPSASRPILAIDTAPRSAGPNRATSSREIATAGDIQSASVPRPESSASAFAAASAPRPPNSSRQRSKKITVACNFCRSRKLRCDGGHPCSQCSKRANVCDYMSQGKRRGPTRANKGGGEESGGESESDDKSGDFHDHTGSLSPEISRTYDAALAMAHHRDDIPPLSASSRSGYPVGERSFFVDSELPHIATLLPETSPGPMSTTSLPPIRPNDLAAQAQRKRSATVPGKTARLPSTSGPKVVACNFCRARKTKCDGALPSCSSCARRMLPCNYAHDATGQTQRKPSTSSASRRQSSGVRSVSPPSSRPVPTPLSAAGLYGADPDVFVEGEPDLPVKRSLENPDAGRGFKKMKTTDVNDDSPRLQDIP